MIIYNKSGAIIVDVNLDDESYRYREIMGDHALTLKFSLAEHVEIPINSYCTFRNTKYFLLRPEALKMQHTRKFEYTVTMQAYEAMAKIWKFRNTVDRRLEFSLTATPAEHLQMFVDNMNRRDTGWEIGECIEAAETCISYDHAYCLDALQQMADEFETEYEITYDGDKKIVSLHKVEYFKSQPLELSYGKGNGFRPEVERKNYDDNTPPVEILFAQGGEDNINPSKYGSSQLLLPKSASIKYDGTYFEDEEGFNEDDAREYITDELGYSCYRADKNFSLQAEDSLDCSSIYPKRVGTVTAVECEDADNHYWNIYDSTLVDEGLDYEDYLIDGETMTIIFQSGMLAGKEFEVSYSLKDGGKFEIVPQEIDGITMPDEESGYYPQVGDTYAVFNCALPDEYINAYPTSGEKTGAEWEMFRYCVKYMYDNEDEQYQISGDLDPIFARANWTNIGGYITLGGFIKFIDERFAADGLKIRITGIKEYINKPYAPELTLSNATITSGVSSTLKTLAAQQVLISDAEKTAITYTKRRYRDAKETMALLEKSLLENFTDSITPITVQTMQALIGDESLQFRFITSLTDYTEVAAPIAYDQTEKLLTVDASFIQHLTLGITDITSSHDNSDYMAWEMAEFCSAVLDDGTIAYYLYAKVPRTTGTAGEFILSATAISLEAEDNYYYLLVGLLNSEYDGERSFVTLYGYTEILPGRITTDRIVSSDGESYFDMASNAMKLGDVLKFNTGGDGLLVLKGTIVQSLSGEVNYLGCYRGTWSIQYTYYQGDEVSYTYNNTTSTYRYINEAPSQGVPPYITTYWQVIAQGSEGTSFTLKGSVESTSDLPETADTGDAYLVSGYLYVWNGTEWYNAGQFKGDPGDTGATGNYFELRYAKNGSTTEAPDLDTTEAEPDGWTTTMPSVSSGEYLWMTMAQKQGSDSTLLTEWSTPVRVTPYDGVDGSSPVMVFRGTYSSSETYYGNSTRRDCVKYNSTYYIARVDAGTFTGITPTSTTKWNSFGASFESVATNLLLAEGANIGDWYISDGKIVSTLSTGNIIELDATNKKITVTSTKSGGDHSEETGLGSKISLDANQGVVEARATGSTSALAYMSPSGIFSNRAGTDCVPSMTGITARAAVVGLGYGDLDDDPLLSGEDFIAGVYGAASNTGTAAAYGGVFQMLKARGLVLNTTVLTASQTSAELADSCSLVISLTTSTCSVYLPAATRNGQIIFLKQMQSGKMRVYPPADSSYVLYDDSSENTYYDCGSGQMIIAVFHYMTINSESKGVWLVNRFKF